MEVGGATGSDPFAVSEILKLQRVRMACSSPTPGQRDLDWRRECRGIRLEALTDAGWLAALIPIRYGGLGYRPLRPPPSCSDQSE